MPKTKGKKSGKGKSSTVVDGLSTEEMSKDQLEEHIIRLREELDREREERSYFQLEIDKIQGFWETCKRSLEELRAELRNRCRERDEAEERHRVEITVYKQKLKHVLSEHQASISEQKMGSVVSSSLIQNEHTQSELGLRRETQSLQADVREKELHSKDCIKELKLQHQVELMELTNDYDKKMRGVETKYHKRMQLMVESENKKRLAEISELEERMKRHIDVLTEDHSRAFRAAEEYYSSIQSKLLADQKLLKEELGELKMQQARVDKELSAAQRQNRELRESLQEAEGKLPELRKQLEEHKQAKAERAMSRARVKLVEQELKDVTVEYELLLQAFEKVQEQRDDLLKKQTQAILDVQQKSRLKEALMERKLAALTETLEKKEAQLCVALSACSAMEGASNGAEIRLEELQESKKATIKALEEDLAEDCKEYENLLQTFKEKLRASSVPPQDFPFHSAEVILSRKEAAGTTSKD